MWSESEIQARLRAPLPSEPGLRDLVRFATLAANGHNTQPWRFVELRDGVSVRPDFSRRTPVVDPDDHHLYVSLGCAAENLRIAARAAGRAARIDFHPEGKGALTVAFGRAAVGGDPANDSLCAAIPARQSTRSLYDGGAVGAQELRALEDAARVEGVGLTIITDAERREEVLEQVIAGNTAQMADKAFVTELRRWIRFNPASAMRTRDGLYGRSSGNPSLPDWIAPLAFPLVFRPAAENSKYARQLRSSAGVAVFSGERNDPEHWTRVGRSFQRFALAATALGVRHAHINQPLEVPALRAGLAALAGMPGRRPDIAVRFGRAPPLPMSFRRCVESVLTVAP